MPRYSIISASSDLSDYDLIVDVRSPSEYAQDHIQGAVNLPVLDDQQRHEVGILYKENGFLAAKKGASFVSENIAEILKHPALEISHTKKILIYCWRGGHRSNSLAHVLSAVGWKVFFINDGYKAYRNHVIESIEQFFTHSEIQLRVISGYTGSGKTHLLESLRQQGAQVLDLESLANHKGSIFGSINQGAQPSQRKFENLLLEASRKLSHKQPIFVEAESNKIGQIYCPAPLWLAMKAATVYEIQLPIQERVKCILSDYSFFTNNPAMVLKLVERLRSLRGGVLVEHWQSLIKQQNWNAFTRSILEEHYDKAYQQAGKQNSCFASPDRCLPVSSFSSDGFSQVAQQLLEC